MLHDGCSAAVSLPHDGGRNEMALRWRAEGMSAGTAAQGGSMNEARLCWHRAAAMNEAWAPNEARLRWHRAAAMNEASARRSAYAGKKIKGSSAAAPASPQVRFRAFILS